MFGSNQSAASTTPKLSALSIQAMGYGVPIQICIGTCRISPTLGYTSDFISIAHQESSGGKGGGGGGGSVSYSYTSTILFFICEGEIRRFGKVWRDKEVYESPTNNGFAFAKGGAGFGFSRTGTYPQDAWPYLETRHPAEALPYNGTVILAASGYALSDQATLGNHAFEIGGRCLSDVSTDQNYTDAYIKDAIVDFLTNPHYGVIAEQTVTLTIDADRLHDYCRATGILISHALSSQKPAHDYLSQWALAANAGIVWSEGNLKFVPYADESFTGNGVAFTADNAIRYAFDDDNVADPIKPKRKQAADCFNNVPFECLDRANDYNKYSNSVKDQAAIDDFGLRPASTLVLDCICLPGVAMQVARTELLRGLYIRSEYTINGWCDADLLEPLDFISITDIGLGMDAVRCRVKTIEDSQDGFLTVTAEEAPEGVYHG